MIKVTSLKEPGYVFYVNPDHIVCIMPKDDGTILIMSNQEAIAIKEDALYIANVITNYKGAISRGEFAH